MQELLVLDRVLVSLVAAASPAANGTSDNGENNNPYWNSNDDSQKAICWRVVASQAGACSCNLFYTVEGQPEIILVANLGYAATIVLSVSVEQEGEKDN